MCKFIRSSFYAICVLLWVALYCSGVIVGTGSYISTLQQGVDDVYTTLWYWAVIFLNYSVSNIALLCCLGAVIGGLSHKDHDPVSMLLARGLFVYFMIMSGTLAIGQENVTKFSQDQYIKLATLASLISFTIGYDPELFRGLLGKARGRISDTQPTTDHPPGNGTVPVVRSTIVTSSPVPTIKTPPKETPVEEKK